jgi:uncharacterized protein (DUF924 family)
LSAALIDEVLHFWFGSNADEAAVVAEKSRLWWSKDAAVDAECRARFLHLVEAAGQGKLDHWASSARGRLALILISDQLPRNIFRGTARAFAFDAAARAHCLEGVALAHDRELRLIERVFFYLPLEHSESLEDQERGVAAYEELAAAAPPEQKSTFAEFHRYAVLHRDIIARFGRFPHRNALLARASTPEETAFLATPGSSF